MPLGYEVFAGNTVDVTTVQEIVEKCRRQLWQIESNLGHGPRDDVGGQLRVSPTGEATVHHRTNKSLLKKFEQELLKQDWKTIRQGIEVKLCTLPREEDVDTRKKKIASCSFSVAVATGR